MTNKKWLLYSLTMIFIILVLNTIFLLMTNTYGIRNEQEKSYCNIPNQKYLIVEYLLNNPKKYDTLIFGSSRIGSINPLKFKNKKAYNMTYGEGLPKEHLLIIKLLLKNKLPIKHILIALDDFSYQVQFSTHQNQFIPKSHYLATGESIIDFYSFYFFRTPREKDFKHFKNKFIDINYVDSHSKMAYKAIFEQKKIFQEMLWIDNNNEDYVNNPRFSYPCHYSGNSLSNTLNDLKGIVEICNQNKIELIFLINPIHHATYKDTNKVLMKDFKQQLSLISDYYDFSTPNKINEDNSNWLDTSHYNVNVGDIIIKRIYDNNISVKNFGIHIKKTN